MVLKSKNKIFDRRDSLIEIIGKNLKIPATIFLACYIGLYFGEMVLSGQLLMTIVIIAGSLFLLRSSTKHKFILLAITVFIPLVFPRFLVQNLKWVDLLSLLFCFFMIINLVIQKKEFFNKEVKIYYVAIGIISIWSLINFARNPVLGGFFGQNVANSGIRTYFSILSGIALFFYSFWYFRDRLNETNRMMHILLTVAFIFGYLRLAGYFLGFSIPFMSSIFHFKGDVGKDFYRIGGLMEMAILGLSVTLTLFNEQKWRPKHVILMSAFLLLIILSGSRAGFMGTLFMFFVYVLVINRRYFLPVTLLIVLAISSFIMFFQQVEIKGQFKRLTAIEGGIQKQDKARTIAFAAYAESFLRNPIFGKGIGIEGELTGKWHAGQISKRDLEIVSKYRGGHGSYHSILAIFGLGGLVYFLIMLYGSIYVAFRVYKERLTFDSESRLALFAFLFLCAQTLVYVSGGTGYTSAELWFLAGMVAALKVRRGGGTYQTE